MIWKKEGMKIHYQNINNLYNLIDITDSYVLIKDKNITKKVYIYEIEPVTFLNFSNELQNNILNLYNEFLRELNLEFQIYISNQKINISNYISKIKEINENSQVSKKYIESIKRELEKQEIYVTKYYIIVSFERETNINIDQIDEVIYKLDYIGCHTKRVKLEKEISQILYEGINKEEIL